MIGMDCAKDAAEIEHAVRSLHGIEAAKVSTATHVLTLHGTVDAVRVKDVEAAVGRMGYRLEPIGTGAETPSAAPAHTAPAYRRALWIVVLLNAGYGIIEMIGGFFAGSQALKADALDFLGDGLITLLGLMAIGWSMAWRARAALLQGIFLGALGLGVLASTAYRIVSQQQPEADVMGILGFVALLVNLASAAVLLPHRTGDANVRAVWLFSRNDAIGNLVVVIAAGLVAWTATPWPDLVVAIVMAGLFLQASWIIVRDGRQDLRDALNAARLPP